MLLLGINFHSLKVKANVVLWKKDNFSSIILAGGLYNVEVLNKDNNFTISAQRTDKPNLNILACVNLTNGASGMNLGEKDSPASTPNC